MTWFNDTLEHLSCTDRDAFEDTCIRFEKKWESNPPIEPNLADCVCTTDPLRVLSTVALVRSDFEMRWRRKVNERKAEDYVETLPILKEYPEALLEIIVWEYQFAHKRGATLESFQHRFPELSGDLAMRIAPPVRMATLPLPARYQGCERLGQGGGGIVARVFDRDTGKPVAIKILRSGVDVDLFHRFQKEVNSLSSISDPGLVHVLDAGEFEGRPYYVMEFCNGGSLKDKLASGRLNEMEAARSVRSLAATLHKVHEHDIYHRDLKPANILLHNGIAKIADFGCAKLQACESSLTESGMLIGTPQYMSPEQAQGNNRETDARTDIYGLGAILYECLTKKPPFVAIDRISLLADICERDVVAPRKLNSGLPRDLETICLKCLAKNPNARYPSAKELADDLGRWIDGEPIKGRRPHWGAALWRKIRRHPWTSIAASVAAIALTAFFVVIVFARIDSNKKSTRIAEERTRQINAFIEFAIESRTWAPLVKAQEYLESALQVAESRVQEEPNNEAHRLTLARIFRNLGVIAGERGQFDRAKEWFKRSLVICHEAEARHPGEPNFLFRTLDASDQLIALYFQMGQPGKAKELANDTLARCENALKQTPVDNDLLQCRAELQFKLGKLLGNAPQAVDHLRIAIAGYAAVQDSQDAIDLARLKQARCHVAIGLIQLATDEKGQAEKEFQVALNLIDPLAKKETASIDARDVCASAHTGVAYARKGQKDAVSSLEAALRIRRALHRIDPESVNAAAKLAAQLCDFAKFNREQGYADPAPEYLKEAEQIIDEVVKRHPTRDVWEIRGSAHGYSGELAYLRRDPKDGERQYEISMASFQRMCEAAPGDVRGKDAYAWMMQSWAFDLNSIVGNRSAAIDKYREATRLYREVVAPALAPKLKEDFGIVSFALGKLFFESTPPQLTEALIASDEAIEMLHPLAHQKRLTEKGCLYFRFALKQRAQLLMNLKRAKDAPLVWDDAITEFSLSDDPLSITLQFDRAATLAQIGLHTEGASRCDELAVMKFEAGTGDHVITLVRIYSICIQKCGADPHLPPEHRIKQVNEYAERSVSFLIRVKHVLRDHRRLEELQSDSLSESIRNREDFKKLIGELRN